MQDISITKYSNHLSQLLPLYLVIFFGFAGYSLMITVFTPLFLHGQGGMLSPDTTLASRAILLGILLGLYPLGQFLGSPVLGALSDHFGRRKILLISLIAASAFYCLIALSIQLQSLFLLMIFSFFAGLGEANIVIAQGAIADVTDEKERNRFFGYIYLSASSAYIVAPLIGGKLADPTLASWFNDATPFWIVFGLLILVFLWIQFFFKETKKSLTVENINYMRAFTNLLNVFRPSDIRKLYLINFLLYLAIFGFFRCYPMYLVDEFKMGVNQVSEFIAWVAVPIVLSNLWLTGFLSRYFSPKTLTVYFAIFTGIFMISIIIFQTTWVLWVTLFLTALALAICLPSCATVLSVAVSPTEQGRVMGNNQSLQVGAEALSGIIGGLLAAIVIQLPLIILALIAIFAAFILIFFALPSHKS